MEGRAVPRYWSPSPTFMYPSTPHSSSGSKLRPYRNIRKHSIITSGNFTNLLNMIWSQNAIKMATKWCNLPPSLCLPCLSSPISASGQALSSRTRHSGRMPVGRETQRFHAARLVQVTAHPCPLCMIHFQPMASNLSQVGVCWIPRSSWRWCTVGGGYMSRSETASEAIVFTPRFGIIYSCAISFHSVLNLVVFGVWWSTEWWCQTSLLSAFYFCCYR